MSLNVFLAVILAAFLHAVWNAMVKNEENKQKSKKTQRKQQTLQRLQNLF